MSERRPQHPQEPAEGSDEAVEEAAGAERAGETERYREASHVFTPRRTGRRRRGGRRSIGRRAPRE